MACLIGSMKPKFTKETVKRNIFFLRGVGTHRTVHLRKNKSGDISEFYSSKFNPPKSILLKIQCFKE